MTPSDLRKKRTADLRVLLSSIVDDIEKHMTVIEHQSGGINGQPLFVSFPAKEHWLNPVLFELVKENYRQAGWMLTTKPPPLDDSRTWLVFTEVIEKIDDDPRNTVSCYGCERM